MKTTYSVSKCQVIIKMSRYSQFATEVKFHFKALLRKRTLQQKRFKIVSVMACYENCNENIVTLIIQ